MNKSKIKTMAISALFTAIIAATAWISVPTPFGINLTLQTFGVCLAAFCLDTRAGLASVAAYIAIGVAGLPVFSSFTGGIGVLLGASGGFLWGFLPTAVLCGAAKRQNKKPLKYLLMVLSVLLCHTAGVVQFCAVSGINAWAGFISASLPFLPKDLIMVFLAEFVSKKIQKGLSQ